MRHVFAQADVAHQHQARDFAFHGARSLLHNTVVGPGSGGGLIFLVRKAEENYRGHAQRMNVVRLFHRFIHGEVEHARHRANFPAHTLASANKHGIDKSLGSKASLAHQAAKLFGAAETAKTCNRKGHANPWLESNAFQPIDFSRSGLVLDSLRKGAVLGRAPKTQDPRRLTTTPR